MVHETTAHESEVQEEPKPDEPGSQRGQPDAKEPEIPLQGHREPDIKELEVPYQGHIKPYIEKPLEVTTRT